MNAETLLAHCTYLDCDRIVPSRLDPIAHITLGEAADLRHEDSCGRGRISQETFEKIRAFRERMAEWDRKWGRW